MFGSDVLCKKHESNEIDNARKEVEKLLRERWSRSDETLFSACDHALGAPGKLIRPLLLTRSAQCVGASPAKVRRAAIATESAHVGSLVHDDIIDGDLTRRGKPAVHALFGVDEAIVAGDAMIFDMFVNLSECRHDGIDAERVVTAIGIAARTGVELCRGQSMEARATRDRDLDLDVALEIGRLKTAALFRCVCEIGAVLGGGSADEVTRLAEYGAALGQAFQIQDDLLAFVSSRAHTGKPDHSDVRNGRPTVPAIVAWARSDTPDRIRLEEALFGGAEPAVAHGTVTAIVRATDAVPASRELARSFMARAQAVLTHFPESPGRRWMEELADGIDNRIA